MDKPNNDCGCETLDTAAKLESSGRPNVKQVTSKDRPEILDWLAGHRYETTGLPRVGFRSDTVACFMNQMECGMVMVDHLVKKPGSKDNEDEGFLVVQACLDWAKNNGFTYIFAVSENKNVKSYSAMFGFERWPHDYLVLRNN